MKEVKGIMEASKSTLTKGDHNYKWVNTLWDNDHTTSYISKIVDSSTLKTIGYAAVTVKDAYFTENLGSYGEGYQMIIYNRFDEPLLVYGDEEILDYRFDYLMEHGIYVSDSGYYMDEAKLGKANWIIKLMINKSYIFDELENIKVIFTIIFIIMSFLIGPSNTRRPSLINSARSAIASTS